MSPDTALARFVARGAARRALPWAVAVGIVVWSSAVTFDIAYPTRGQRIGLAASLHANVGLTALFGPMHRLDTVWGFTTWRSAGVLAIVGGVWGCSSGARLLRGEEDAGRWDLVLTGATTRRRAAAVGLAAGAAGVVLLWLGAAVAVALGRLAAPLPWTTAVAVATTVVLPAAMFFSISALCGQLLSTRQLATRFAAGLFGAAFLLRVVATTTGHAWLSWLSPIGWVDRLQPLRGMQLLPLLLSLGVSSIAGCATVALAGRRDAGSGVVALARTRAASGTALLGSGAAFAVRSLRTTAAGWAVGMAVVSTVLGLVSHSVADVARRSGALRAIADRLGATSDSRLFLGVAMTVVLSAVALAAATTAAATADVERTGRLDVLLAGSTSRVRWLAGRLGAAALLLALLGAVVGLALWAATSAAGSGLPLPTALAAGANVVPPALFVLGAATFAFGWSPRLVAPVGVGVVAWSFLLDLVGSMVDAPTWLLDFSLLHHVAVAPATDPRWGTAGVLAGIGLVAAAAGLIEFARRDVTSG